jgi:glycosyltransferase involved in cell wall biosynthesis
MPVERLRILHAIHDFLPRHRAGSEIYAFDLCRALAGLRHHITVLCAEFNPGRPHGDVTWRVEGGLPVVELTNNWKVASFADTYRSPAIGARIGQVLAAVQPDVVHVHNLLNLSFDLPAIARASGVPVVATLHDYTLVCASGGQRVHRAERHVCDRIDAGRCVRCFGESPFSTQMAFSAVSAATGSTRLLPVLAASLNRRMPAVSEWAARAGRRATAVPLTEQDIGDRLVSARAVFDAVDLFVAPSPSIATEFKRLGLPPEKIRISDYGFAPVQRVERGRGNRRPVRIGYVGTLVWHKGVHVLIDAVRPLPGADYELKIFGDPSVFPDYSSHLRAQAAGLPVAFMGPFDRASASTVYADIDVLVVPSLWLENSPLVIHEAFMAGVPVVGAAIGGIADLVQNGVNGLLYPPGSSAALEEALRGLLERPERLAGFAERLPAVKSIDEDAREWEGFYKSVLHCEQAAGIDA